MELGAFAAALVRRWYLVVLAVALAAGAALMTLTAVGPSYETRASVLLFPPSSDGSQTDEPTSTNPYLELGGLTTARDILIRRLTSQSSRDALEKTHPDAGYGLAPDTTSAGPIVIVEVSATTAAQALDAQAALLDEFPGALADLQQGLGLSRPEFITARELTVDARAEVVHKSQIRAAIVAVVGVMALALALIGLIDGWLIARTQSRRVASDAADGGEDERDGDDPEDLQDEAADPTEPHGQHERVARLRSARAPEAAPTGEDTAPARSKTSKTARKQARRSARDQALRVARDESREMDRGA